MPESSVSSSNVWHTSGGDNSRRGWFDQPVRTGSTPGRRLKAHGAIHASVVFDLEHRALVADLAGWVHAFTADGHEVWSRQLEGGVSATPAVDPETNRLFVGTHRGWVYALESASGVVQWRKELPTSSDARILSDLLCLPAHGIVVASSWGGRFYALEVATGNVRFSWDAGLWPYSAAAADRNEWIYCLRAVEGPGVQCLRVSPEGKETVLCQQPGEGRPANRLWVAAAPALDPARGVVYFVANTGVACRLHAWSCAENRVLWSHRLPASVRATPAITGDGTILLADLQGYLHAVAPQGTSCYRYAAGCEYVLAGAISEQDGSAWVGDPLGRLHAIDRDGRGKPVFQAPRSIQARLSFDPSGNLCVPCTDRQVYVFLRTQV